MEGNSAIKNVFSKHTKWNCKALIFCQVGNCLLQSQSIIKGLRKVITWLQCCELKKLPRKYCYFLALVAIVFLCLITSIHSVITEISTDMGHQWGWEQELMNVSVPEWQGLASSPQDVHKANSNWSFLSSGAGKIQIRTWYTICSSHESVSHKCSMKFKGFLLIYFIPEKYCPLFPVAVTFVDVLSSPSGKMRIQWLYKVDSPSSLPVTYHEYYSCSHHWVISQLQW